MINGVSGAPIPVHLALPYANTAQQVAQKYEFPPCLLYAISFRESIGEYGLSAAYQMSDNGDGGHGLCQLTSSFPSDWYVPISNYEFAVLQFLKPAWEYWVGQGEAGDNLCKLVADSFNAGLTAAIEGHEQGNADLYSTDSYGSNVVRIMHQLLNGEQPTL